METRIWVIQYEEVTDCERKDSDVELYTNHDDALAAYYKRLGVAEHFFTSEAYGWDTDQYDYNDSKVFEAWSPKDGYVCSHYILSLTSKILK